MRDVTDPLLLGLTLVFFPVVLLVLVQWNGPTPLTALANNTIGVPEDYSTIQAAIDAAADGDLVLVGPGTYSENLLIAGKSVILASHFHTTGDDSFIDQTIIDGQGLTTISVDATAGLQTRITGFTIQNGNDGISARANLEIDHNRIVSNGDGLDYEGGGGLCRDNVFEDNSDDAIDFDGHTGGAVENNIIQFNGDDGIEIRLHAYSGPTLTIVVRNNVIHGNGEDGIQLIDYPDVSDRVFYIERNQITNNAMVGLGLMDNGETQEDFRAASIPERIHLYNNTFSGNPYAVTGGDNLIALNNLFMDASTLALKNLDGGPAGSIAAYNLYWNNGSDSQGSNVDTFTSVFGDPLLDEDYQIQPGSPAIDAGTANFVWNGETVIDIPLSDYDGSAPDLGWFEATPAQTPCGCLMQSTSVRVSTGNDDAEESNSSGSVNLSSSDLELVNGGGSDPQTVGIRFQGIAIPAGVTITNAYIEFETDATDSAPTSLVFHGEAGDNPAQFTSTTGNITSRSVTATSVSWDNLLPWNTVDEKHQTPDLSAIVQELVDRNGWASGNAMVFIVTGSGERTAESFDGEEPAAPRLFVEFCSTGNGQVTEVRTLLPSEWGVPHPAGLSYSLDRDHLALLEKRDPDQPTADASTIVVITPFEDLVGTANLAFVADNAINIAYDDANDSLLLLNNEQAELARVAVGEDGIPDPNSLASFDVVHLGLHNADGIGVDLASRRLLILDSGTSQVVSADVDNEFELISKIDLSHLDAPDLRGIAIHPTSHNLFVVSPTEEMLYELTESGQLVNSYSLAVLDLADPRGLAFGPSADPTDDPNTIHLFMADSNLPNTEQLFGRVLEVALAPGCGGTSLDQKLSLPMVVSHHQELADVTRLQWEILRQ